MTCSHPLKWILIVNEEDRRKLLQVNGIDCKWWFHGRVLSSKLFKSYTLIMHSFLCVNHTSVEWLKKGNRLMSKNKVYTISICVCVCVYIYVYIFVIVYYPPHWSLWKCQSVSESHPSCFQPINVLVNFLHENDRIYIFRY